MQHPVIRKNYIGKPPKDDKAETSWALSYDGFEEVEYLPLDAILDHLYVKGKLLIVGNWDIALWKQDKKAGIKAATARQGRYWLGSSLLIVDVDDGLPQGTVCEVAESIISSSEIIQRYCAAIFPSSRYANEKPKLHLVFALNETLTNRDEYMNLHARLRAALPFVSDHATAKPEQPLYGTALQFIDPASSALFEGDEENVLSVEFLRSLPETEPLKKERAEKKARRERVEKEGVRLHENAKRGKREVQRALTLALFILAENGGKMSNEDWYIFRLAAAAASGHSLVVFDAIAASEYWKRWGDEWDVAFERNRWDSEAPREVTVGTLYWMAHERGWGTTNAAAIEPDYVIDDLSGIPFDASYLLRADTGIGKSEAQREAIQRMRAAGKKVYLLSPTKSLARAAATAYGATLYLDENDVIKAAEDLRAADFVSTTPQTFARRIAPGGLKDCGLIILDEVQQIASAVFGPNNKLWKDRTLVSDFLAAIEAAKQQEGLILRGLDAGLAMQAQMWLGLPVYDCTQTRENAPVTFNKSRGAHMRLLLTAVETSGGEWIYVTDDTVSDKNGREGAENLYRDIQAEYPQKRVLLITADTVNMRRSTCDPRALAFLNNPNEEVWNYDVIITSPTMLTGVSIKSRPAKYVFQFCKYLPPKSNLQMLNRVRAVTEQVFIYMRCMFGVGDVDTPEQAVERSETLLEGILHLERSDKALRYEYLRWLGELDLLYQSFDPVTYYAHLLREEGREVTFDEDNRGAYQSSRPQETDEAREWALNNYQNEEVKLYDPLMNYRGLAEREFKAMLIKTEVDRKTEGGYKYAEDKRLVALAASEFKNHQLGLVEVATGARPLSNRVDILASDPNTPPSLLKSDHKLIVLLHAIHILGYMGGETISAQTFVDHGREFVQFLWDNRRYWNAVFPRTKHMELSDDYVTDARALCKDLLLIIGLKMRRGNNTRILNPCSGARLYDAEIQNIGALKHLLYLRACGRAGKDLLNGIEIVFKELAMEASSRADQEALAWFEAQTENVKEAVRVQMRLANVTLVNATLDIRDYTPMWED